MPIWGGGGGGSGSGIITQITRTVLGSPAATIDFSSIPGTYENLILEYMIAGDDAVNHGDQVHLRFNNDSGSNYDYGLFAENNNTIVETNQFGQTFGTIGYMASAADGAGDFGMGRIWIPSYARTVLRKGAAAQGGSGFNADGAATNTLAFSTYVNWHNTGAVTRITLLPNTSTHFVTGSVATLYGSS